MTKPLIVVMSDQPRWTSELPSTGSSGYRFCTCSTLEELQKVSSEQTPDGVIADLSRVSGGGHLQEQQLEVFRQNHANLPIAMLTDEACPEPLERRALYSGMLHLKGEVTIDSVIDWIHKVIPAEDDAAESEMTSEGVPLLTEPFPGRSETRSDRTVLSGITCRFETFTPQLKRMLGELEIAADKDVTMLLIGETGSGKTFLSNLIHEVSRRRDEPFITVACGALPGDLIESELFGHMKGSFTSAHADKDGKFIAAGRGTILLDEIDVLSPEQQVKLLRVIETGKFEPVGSNITLTSKARLVVASNLALEPLVEQGKFRPDLYYRLSMLKFEIAPLRSRRADIKPMSLKFIQDKAEKHEVVVHRIEQEFFDSLLTYPWPGNVRELEYAIQRAVIYCADGVLKAEHLPSHIIAGVAGPTNDPTVKLESRRPEADSMELTDQLATTEKDLIEQALGQRGREVSQLNLQYFGEELIVPSGALPLSFEA
ncbi:MAG: sigma 54-interacting transcriptional regulator, partial [Planctomycetota bacterium]|nr:sigma 54-interacting transcriptional regulator [Planctomycetota bacterium]